MPQKNLLLQEIPRSPVPFCSLPHPPPDIQCEDHQSGGRWHHLPSTPSRWLHRAGAPILQLLRVRALRPCGHPSCPLMRRLVLGQQEAPCQAGCHSQKPVAKAWKSHWKGLSLWLEGNRCTAVSRAHPPPTDTHTHTPHTDTHPLDPVKARRPEVSCLAMTSFTPPPGVPSFNKVQVPVPSHSTFRYDEQFSYCVQIRLCAPWRQRQKSYSLGGASPLSWGPGREQVLRVCAPSNFWAVVASTPRIPVSVSPISCPSGPPPNWASLFSSSPTLQVIDRFPQSCSLTLRFEEKRWAELESGWSQVGDSACPPRGQQGGGHQLPLLQWISSPLLSELLDFINALGAVVAPTLFHSFHPLAAPTLSQEECLGSQAY